MRNELEKPPAVTAAALSRKILKKMVKKYRAGLVSRRNGSSCGSNNYELRPKGRIKKAGYAGGCH